MLLIFAFAEDSRASVKDFSKSGLKVYVANVTLREMNFVVASRISHDLCACVKEIYLHYEFYLRQTCQLNKSKFSD